MAVSQNLTLTQTSQDTAGNSSRVRIRWTSTQSGESYNGYSKTAYYYVSINGAAEVRYSATYTLPKSTTKTIVDTTITVKHRTDGTASVRVRTSMDTGISAGTIEQTKSLTLDTIPRATQPSVSVSSVNMGASVTISTPRASSGFTHDLAYKFAGGAYTNIATGVGTSYSWTVPDLASSIPNATSGTVTIRCITKSGSTTIGTKTVLLTAKVPASVVPTIGTVSVAETTAGIAAQFGAFIQSKSKIKATISASGAKGSTIKSYSSTFAGTTYTGSTWTTGAVSKSGTLAIVTTVTDSRGRTAKKTTNVSVLAYSKPKISRFTALRAQADGTADPNGTAIKVSYQYSVPSLSGGNTASMKVEYKRSTDTTWTNAGLAGTALSANTTSQLSGTYSTDYSFDFRITVTDWFGVSSVYETTLPSGAVIVDIGAAGDSIGVGTTAQQAGINIGWGIVGQAMTASGTYGGRYETHDGLLVQWGRQTVTPTAAGTTTTQAMTFGKTYNGTPVVMVTPVTSVPHNVRASVANVNSTGFDLVLNRTDTVGTGIQWVAIGIKA